MAWDGSFFLALFADRSDRRGAEPGPEPGAPGWRGAAAAGRPGCAVAPRPEIRTYDAWLARVAKVAAEGLGRATPAGASGGAAHAEQPGPVDCAVRRSPPPPPADPTPFSLDLPVKPVKPSLTGGTGVDHTEAQELRGLARQESTAPLGSVPVPGRDARTKVEFDEPGRGAGTWASPIRESFRPLSAILPVWWLEEDELLGHRSARHAGADEGIMVEPALYYALNDRGTSQPCKMAARAHYCHNAEAAGCPGCPTASAW
ncbi:MAG: hypothetical protein R3F43_21645 [bacterium]